MTSYIEFKDLTKNLNVRGLRFSDTLAEIYNIFRDSVLEIQDDNTRIEINHGLYRLIKNRGEFTAYDGSGETATEGEYPNKYVYFLSIHDTAGDINLFRDRYFFHRHLLRKRVPAWERNISVRDWNGDGEIRIWAKSSCPGDWEAVNYEDTYVSSKEGAYFSQGWYCFTDKDALLKYAGRLASDAGTQRVISSMPPAGDGWVETNNPSVG
jgi:hypothetical protein